MQSRAAKGFAVVRRPRPAQLDRMSLNRFEQRIFDYLQVHPEERQYWMDKVRATAARMPNEAAVAKIEAELWRYYEERSAVAEPFRQAARAEGLHRSSMRNLSEFLLRLWIDPKPAGKGSL